MKKSVVLIGIGEIGGVFARGILKSGYPLIPVTRQMNTDTLSRQIPDPEAVVVAVAEKDLQDVLKSMPKLWQDKLILLQNELLPRDWQLYGITSPTVISVWFEKKPGQDVNVLIPSPVFGPKAHLIEAALTSIKISVRVLQSDDELLFELVLKNLYILTVNICGLSMGGGTVFELWNNHQSFALEVSSDVLDIQEFLAGKNFNRKQLIDGMLKAFEGDWQHKCLGRTAQARLVRSVGLADQAGLKVNKLREILAKPAERK